MTVDDRPDSADLELPVGELVATEPATIPGPRTLEGRWVTLRPVDPQADGADLHRASHGGSEREALWTYMAYGPFGAICPTLLNLAHQSLKACVAIFCPRSGYDPLILRTRNQPTTVANGI